MKSLMVGLILFGLAVGGPVAARGSAPAPPGDAGTAPAFSLPTDSGTVSLDSLRGKVVLVDFWASWCGPCQQSFPWLSEIQERYGDAGLEVVAVSLDKEHAAAERFLHEHPASFTVAFDPAADIAKAYHVRGMPTSVLIGADGTILYSHVGFDARKTGALESAIAEAVGS